MQTRHLVLPPVQQSRQRHRSRSLAGRCTLALLLAATLLGSVQTPGRFALVASAAQAADEDEGEGEDPKILTDRQKLAKEFSDPLTTLPQVFFQDAYTPANYGTDAGTNRVIGRIIVPRIPKYSLLPSVQLVRPSFSLVTVPTGKGSGTRTEFGDMQLFDAFVLPWHPLEGLTMAVGPTLVFPTATHKSAGQGAWQVGPLFGALYKGVPWLLTGCLIQNPISFAYTSPDRQKVSSLIFQPIVLMALAGGWYIKSADSSWLLNWQERSATVIPVSFGVGRVLIRDGMPPLNFYVSGEWTAYRQFAPVAPQTTVRFGLTIAFPGMRPWE